MSEIHRQTPMKATPTPRVEGYSPPATWISFAAALDVVILYSLTAGRNRSA